jgi:TrmH family RNA methyltransferase
MELPFKSDGIDLIGRKRFSVILVWPENQENVGLVARAMKNTGFSDLRIVGIEKLGEEAFRTAIHSEDILEKACFYPNLSDAISSLHIVLASTARFRSKFAVLPIEEAVETAFRFPRSTKVGLLFGNERTGLTSEELRAANYVFSIPQAVRQPSYNLASAVLLTLFAFFIRSFEPLVVKEKRPLFKTDQEECLRVILMKLKQSGFIHTTNETHITQKVHDLFGRIALNEKDRKLLMAIFNKALDSD